MRAEFNFVRKSSGSEHSRHILTRMDQTFNKKKTKKTNDNNNKTKKKNESRWKCGSLGCKRSFLMRGKYTNREGGGLKNRNANAIYQTLNSTLCVNGG